MCGLTCAGAQIGFAVATLQDEGSSTPGPRAMRLPGLPGTAHVQERSTRAAVIHARQSWHAAWRRAMNWDRIEGNWKQLSGKVKESWGKLTDDDIDIVNGRREQLVGRIQERYDIARDEAEQQVKDWMNRM
jgi:uncharacterized protein YjbJ (UPF0337 family)